MTIEEKTIELKGTLKFEEFSPKRKVIVEQIAFAIAIIVLIFSAIAIYYVLGSQLYILLEYPLVMLVLILVSLLIIIFAAWFWGKKITRIMRKNFEPSNIRNEQTYIINSKTITREIEGNLLHLNWYDVFEFKEYNDIFDVRFVVEKRFANLFFISKNNFSNLSDNLKLDRTERRSSLCIPKRFFQSESDMIYFKELVKKNIRFKKTH